MYRKVSIKERNRHPLGISLFLVKETALLKILSMNTETFETKDKSLRYFFIVVLLLANQIARFFDQCILRYLGLVFFINFVSPNMRYLINHVIRFRFVKQGLAITKSRCLLDLILSVNITCLMMTFPFL